MITMDGIAMSVIIVSPADYKLIRLTVSYLSAQTVRESLEIVIAAPSEEVLGLVESDMKGFHSYQVVETGKVSLRGRSTAAAVRAARGPIVAMCENHAFPEPEWAEALIRTHEGPWAGVCPVVEIFNPRTVIGRTAQFVDYGTWSAHDEPTEIGRLPWHNSSYKRDLVMQFDGELETLLEVEEHLQEQLRAQGHRFFLEPAARIRHVSDSTIPNALSAMFGRGRIFAVSRLRNWNLARKCLYALTSPVFPFIRLYQIRENYRRLNKQYLLIRLTPTIFLLMGAIAAGESAGYLFGMGGSMDWIARHELEIELRASAREIKEMHVLLEKRLGSAS